jgi:hypothetical protein
VFLIELLNIDLFHWHQCKPEVRNFSGIVYRGMTLSEKGLCDFKSRSTQAVRNRNWAVPLSMMSASQRVENALDFAINHSRTSDDLLKPVLLRIHVESLDSDALELYRKHFPTSIVTSLCAVPIAEISAYKGEDEVLLRGPFFHQVRIREEVFERYGKVHVIDTVMITSNRDHPSTMALNSRDYPLARKLFGALNWMARSLKCAELAEQYGLQDDASAFRTVYKEEVQTRDLCLREILGH